MYPLPNWSLKTPEWRPEEGHNGYLDVYVELGGIGVVLLLGVIGAGLAGAVSDLQNNFQLGSLRLVLLIGILMNNFAETSFLKGTHDLWFLFLLAAMNLPLPKKGLVLKGAPPVPEYAGHVKGNSNTLVVSRDFSKLIAFSGEVVPEPA